MTLNADESLLASCDSMGQILIWDALSIFSAAATENDEHYPNSPEQQQQCPTRCFSPQQGLYQESLTRSVLWNPFDATILMSGSMRGYLTMWDVESGTIMCSINTKSSILSMAWSREANELITANNCYASGIGTINIWNPKTLNWKLECDCERMPILSLSLSDDGSTLGCIFDGGCQGTGTTMTNQAYVATFSYSGLSTSNRPRTEKIRDKFLKESPLILINYIVPGALVIR